MKLNLTAVEMFPAQICSSRRVFVPAGLRRLAERVMEGEGCSDQVCVIALAPSDRVSAAFCCAGAQVSDRRRVQTPSGED